MVGKTSGPKTGGRLRGFWERGGGGNGTMYWGEKGDVYTFFDGGDEARAVGAWGGAYHSQGRQKRSEGRVVLLLEPPRKEGRGEFMVRADVS